jgi:predicted transcriptional regulator
MESKNSVCNIYPKVALLDSIHVDDGPPNMTGSSTDNIRYDMGTLSSSDFKDIVAFPSSDFTEETKVLQEMSDLLQRGKEFKSLLYTQRSVSKALPKTQQDTDEATKTQIHEKTVEVLEDTMKKLNKVREFTEHAVQVVRKNIQRLVQSEMKKAVQSERKSRVCGVCVYL